MLLAGKVIRRFDEMNGRSSDEEPSVKIEFTDGSELLIEPGITGDNEIDGLCLVFTFHHPDALRLDPVKWTVDGY